MNKHSLIIAKAEAKGSILATKRFDSSEKAEADAWCARWRRSGARTTVTVASPPPPPRIHSRVDQDFAGPDSKWGGWNTAETNDLLDRMELVDAIYGE